MFGLTFKQLAYAFLFFGSSLLILKFLGLGWVGIMLAIFPSLLGIGFIFLNFDSLIKDYLIYFRSRKCIVKKSELNKFLGIKKVKKEYIFNSEGKRIAVFKISPINFSIKHPDEKETVIKSFQKFLNALDFPTQLLINTESIDVESYLKSVEERASSNPYPELLKQHENHLREKVNDKKITNRVFYLVILEKDDITIQVDLCKERLSALNLKYEQLKGKELRKITEQFIPFKKSRAKRRTKDGKSKEK